jgi:ribonuclease HI
MIRLPVSLENRLKKLFPRVRERERFVIDTLKRALDHVGENEEDQPESIGGTLHLFSDGGSRGNPGQSAIACVLEDPENGETVREHFERIGIETNNVAEYRALIEGLKIARRYHPNHLVCHLDSELLVKQINGEYQVKMHTLAPLYDEIKDLEREFADIQFVHIPRTDNFRADALVNKALDEHPAPPYEKPT